MLKKIFKRSSPADDASNQKVLAGKPALEKMVAETSTPVKPRSHKLPMRDFIAGMEFPYTQAVPRHANLAYASASKTQKLDIYLPEGEGPFPLVILVHGGGFGMGDKSHMVSKAGTDVLLDNGYAVANVNYRLSGEARAPAQIHDLKTAVRWLRANATKYHLDPNRFGAWGASAGGTIAALLGTSYEVSDLEGAELGCSQESSCVQAVVDWFGPVDFLTMDDQFSGWPDRQTHNAPDSPESLLIGAPIQSRPDLVKIFSPITYISSNAAPFLIQHGLEDNLVPVQQSQLLYQALLPVLGADKVTLTLLPGASHGGGAQFWSLENVETVLNFLDRFLT
jgi:acetyl esterase/lipase